MERKDLLKNVIKYKENNPKEDITVLENFIKDNINPFTRKNLEGHVTCSSWIVDQKMEKALLIHNTKFDKWLQPGGHMEEGESVFEAALREGIEETGIKELDFYKKEIFDIDIHQIPENKKKGEPAHYHYDIRFITQAKDYDVSIDKEECSDFQWIDLKELKTKTEDQSILRMIEKTEELSLELNSKKRRRQRP